MKHTALELALSGLIAALDSRVLYVGADGEDGGEEGCEEGCEGMELHLKSFAVAVGVGQLFVVS
jgi:hypothetical protein